MILTFKLFCYKFCDGLYDPFLSDDKQCTGYYKLLQLVKDDITPASREEVERWKQSPTPEELWNPPENKYLQFLHPLVRPLIIDNWDYIKELRITKNENEEIVYLFELVVNAKSKLDEAVKDLKFENETLKEKCEVLRKENREYFYIINS